MSTIGDIAVGLKTNLDTIEGVNVSRYPRSNPVGPLIHMWPTEIVYHRASQMGLSELTFRVQLLWPYTDDAGSASQVYAFLDPSGERSVRQAIESDRTLSGAVEDVIVDPAGELVVTATQDNQLRLTADWTVRILLNGSA
jgi:hypothetical protein